MIVRFVIKHFPKKLKTQSSQIYYFTWLKVTQLLMQIISSKFFSFRKYFCIVV